MKPYQYRCNDYSLLTPPFKRWVITPLINFVPWGIPANVITLISNFFVYIGLFLALQPETLGRFTYIAIAACLLLYLIGDHLDGMQAKRTGTGSALGEFCDHYLDAFNNGIIVFTMFVVFDVYDPAIAATALVISYVAHMAVFYEQFKTGWLTFEKVGSLEGVVMSSLLIAFSAIDPFYHFMTHPIVGRFTPGELVVIASTLGALSTFFQTYLRTPRVKRGYKIFVIMLTTLGILGGLSLDIFQLFVVITLYASLYIGKLMYGHLVNSVESQTDWVVPVALVFYLSFGFGNVSYIFWIITAYLTYRILALIVKTFSTLGVYWVWRNSRVQ